MSYTFHKIEIRFKKTKDKVKTWQQKKMKRRTVEGNNWVVHFTMRCDRLVIILAIRLACSFN
ncbi:hypothetical protein OIU79_027843 [Salix purpurea]|uniref:Uncharacterized protein n=1 Tax=Salix purpurea TaxID=77065 RepID=A0A9Q1A1Y5_SALPP|nr:hypothetical protein OIU79_027843 [Salix purpurea]